MADNADSTAEQASASQTAASEQSTDPYAGLPEEFAWLKNDLEATRREAAGRRVELRELQEKTKDAKTPEEYQAAVAEAARKGQELEVELARERVARKHSLDDELLEFLTGKNADEIEAQAVKLAALKPTAPITRMPPTGGVNPSQGTPPDVSGRDVYRQYKKGRR